MRTIDDWTTTSMRPLMARDSRAKITTPATVTNPSPTPVARIVRTSRRSTWADATCAAWDMDGGLRRMDWAKLVRRYQLGRRQLRRPLDQVFGRGEQPRRDHAADEPGVHRDAIEGRRCPEVHHHGIPVIQLHGGEGIHHPIRPYGERLLHVELQRKF